jgi:hypothetical protein
MYGDDFVTTESVHLALSKIKGGLAVSAVGGQTFFLDNSDSDAADTQNGGTYRNPFAKLGYAVEQMSPGDTLLVKQGHDETLDATVTVPTDQQGIGIIGLGFGDFRPRFVFNSTYHLDLNTEVMLDNLRLHVGVDTKSDKMIDIGQSAVIQRCEIYGDGTKEVDTVINIVDGISAVKVLFCDVNLLSAPSPYCDNFMLLTGNNHYDIEVAYNSIQGAFTTSIFDRSGAAAGIDSIIIAHNYLRSTNPDGPDTQTGQLINFDAADKGFVVDNRGYMDNAGTSRVYAINADGLSYHENYFSAESAKSGGLVPSSIAT